MDDLDQHNTNINMILEFKLLCKIRHKVTFLVTILLPLLFLLS